VGELFEKSSPTPPQKLSNSNYQNRFVSLQTDGRREDKPRFCYREFAGVTETLRTKKVE
jgi:hypothetical protein